MYFERYQSIIYGVNPCGAKYDFLQKKMILHFMSYIDNYTTVWDTRFRINSNENKPLIT